MHMSYEETSDEGEMNFKRAVSMMGQSSCLHGRTSPTADGQLGCVVRLSRMKFLAIGSLGRFWNQESDQLFPKRWDTDGDGVLDGEQHNTMTSSLRSQFRKSTLSSMRPLRAVNRQVKRDEEQAKAGKTCSQKAASLWISSVGMAVLHPSTGRCQRLQVSVWYRLPPIRCLGSFWYVAGLGYLLPKEHVARQFIPYTAQLLAGFSDHVNPNGLTF